VEQKCEALCDALAKRVVEKNFTEAHALFAPWLQTEMSPTDIEQLVHEAAAGTGSARTWTLDEGGLGVEDLGASRNITKDNYRGWLCIQFNPGEGHDGGSFDLWLAAVETDGDYRVGLIEALGAE
jgi:hypothetical protein